MVNAVLSTHPALHDAALSLEAAERGRTGATPRGPGRTPATLQSAIAYKEQTVAEATGQAARFLKVFDEYKKAPEVTPKRMYLETMERVLGASDEPASTLCGSFSMAYRIASAA